MGNEQIDDEDNVVHPPAQGVRAGDGTGINSSLLTWDSMWTHGRRWNSQKRERKSRKWIDSVRLFKSLLLEKKILSIDQHSSQDSYICFDFDAIFGKGNNLKILKQLVCVVFVAITHKLIHTQWKFNNGTSWENPVK